MLNIYSLSVLKVIFCLSVEPLRETAFGVYQPVVDDTTGVKPAASHRLEKKKIQIRTTT